MSVIFTKWDVDTASLDLLAISDHEEGECPNHVIGGSPSFWDSTKCTICGGKRATGGWDTHDSQIRVCFRCAIDVLPALIADALVGDRVAMRSFSNRLSIRNDLPERDLKEISATFWRAYAIALSHASHAVSQGNKTLDCLAERATEAKSAS